MTLRLIKNRVLIAAVPIIVMGTVAMGAPRPLDTISLSVMDTRENRLSLEMEKHLTARTSIMGRLNPDSVTKYENDGHVIGLRRFTRDSRMSWFYGGGFRFAEVDHGAERIYLEVGSRLPVSRRQFIQFTYHMEVISLPPVSRFTPVAFLRWGVAL